MAQIDKDYFKINNEAKQNEVKDILGEDEEILLSLSPNKRTYVFEALLKGLPLALIWGAIDIFAIIMMINGGVFSSIGITVLFVILFFAIHLIPVWIYIGGVVKKITQFKNISYTFTDKRIIVRSGLIGIDFKYVYYTNIDSVNVKVGFFDKLFKVGDLYITSSNQTVYVEDISSPYQYADKIQDLVRDLNLSCPAVFIKEKLILINIKNFTKIIIY